MYMYMYVAQKHLCVVAQHGKFNGEIWPSYQTIDIDRDCRA